MDKIIIRVMVISDYQKVYDLWASTPGMGMNPVDDSFQGIEKFLKRNPNTNFVAEDSGRIIGVILCGHDGRRGHIYHTAVSQNCRKRGIGHRLTEAAMEALKSEGIAKATLVAFETNHLGNSFWESEGFTKREDLVYRNKSLNSQVR